MKRGSTIILRGVVVLMGLVVLSLCVFALPHMISAELEGDFDYGFIAVGMYVAAVPFFIGLYHVLKLVHYVDKNKAFSDASVRSLKCIKYCGFTISGLYTLGLPYIFYIAQQDDAPGMVLIGLILAFAPLAIAVFAAVLQKYLQSAIDIKSENDLTV